MAEQQVTTSPEAPTMYGDFVKSGDYRKSIDAQLGIDRDFDPNKARQVTQPAPEQKKEDAQPTATQPDKKGVSISEEEYKEFLRLKAGGKAPEKVETKTEDTPVEKKNDLDEMIRKVLNGNKGDKPEGETPEKDSKPDGNDQPKEKATTTQKGISGFTDDDKLYAKKNNISDKEMELYDAMLSKINSAGKIQLAKALVQEQFGQKQQPTEKGVPSAVSIGNKSDPRESRNINSRPTYDQLLISN